MKKLLLLVIFSLFCKINVHAEIQESPIKIGAALHLTGEYASAGNAFRQGIELAVDEINASGGILGIPVTVLIEDTAYDMRTVQSVVRKLISVDQVQALLVSNYTEAMRVGKLVERSKVPAVTIWDSSPDLEALGRYTFGVGAWSPSAAEVSARYARQVLQKKRAVVICTEAEWSLKVGKYFSDSFTQQGGEVIKQVTVLPTETDFRSLFSMVRSLEPDLIYAPVSDSISAFFGQLSDANIKATVMTSDVLSEELINLLGKKVEGVFQTQLGELEGAVLPELLEKYKNKYKLPCTQSLYLGLGYDAMKVIAHAIVIAKGGDRESITSGLYQVQNLQGATGIISISAEGSSKILEKMYRISQGKLTHASQSKITY